MQQVHTSEDCGAETEDLLIKLLELFRICLEEKKSTEVKLSSSQEIDSLTSLLVLVQNSVLMFTLVL